MKFEEKTLNSQTVYDGKIIKVLKDDVEISDGHKSFREVVRHSGGVVILAIKPSEKGKSVLFVKQFRYPMKEVLLELPGMTTCLMLILYSIDKANKRKAMMIG